MGIKRINYFKGEFLTAEDFIDEQQYHIEMLREHNKNLHAWGIAEGLDVPNNTGGKTVKIESGMAIDSQGCQIILIDSVDKPIPDTTAKELYLTISYYDKELTDPRDDNTGAGFQNTRIEEKPLIEFFENSNFDISLKLILAKLTLDDQKKISKVDKSGRQRAGVKGDLAAGSIALSVDNVASDQWPRLKGVDANKLEISAKSGLQINSDKTSLNGSLIVNDKVGIGTTATLSEKLEVNGKVKATAFMGDGSLITALNGTQITNGIVADARIPATISRETRFDPASGHKHTGAAGDGPIIQHSSLGNILAVNPASTDTALTKHVSDALAKSWQDHINTKGNPHGTTAAQLGDYLAKRGTALLTFSNSDANGATKTANLGFIPKLILIGGGLYTNLGGTALGSSFSGFWCSNTAVSSAPYVIKSSSTYIQNYSVYSASPFYIYIYYNDTSTGMTKPKAETVYGAISFSAEGIMTVTLSRTIINNCDPLDSFTIYLALLGIS